MASLANASSTGEGAVPVQTSWDISPASVVDTTRSIAEQLHHRALVESQVEAVMARNQAFTLRAQIYTMFDRASSGMFIVGDEERLVKVNDSFARMLGRSAADLVGESIWDLTAEEDIPAEIARIGDLHSGKVSFLTRQKSYRHADGSLVPVVVSTSLISMADGASASLTTVESIVDYLAAETRVLEIASAFDGIVSLDESGRVTSWNSGAERLFGWAAADMLGGTLDSVTPPRLRAQLISALKRSSAPDRMPVTESLEVPAVHADGHALRVELTLSAWSAHGRVGYTAVVRDVAHTQQAQREADLLAFVASAANAAHTFEAACRTVLAEVCETFGWTAAVSWTLTPGPGRWHIADHHQHSHPGADAGTGCALMVLAQTQFRPPSNRIPIDGQYRISERATLLEGPMRRSVIHCGVERAVIVPVMAHDDYDDTHIHDSTSYTASSGQGGAGRVVANLSFFHPAGSPNPTREVLTLLQQIGILLGPVLQRQTRAQLLSFQANHDPLTGLVNRHQLLSDVGRALSARAASETAVHTAVLLLDLDRFKRVNKSLGHAAGDEALTEVARRLTAAAPECTVARLGGDEFAVLAHGRSPIRARELAARLLESLKQPVRIAGRDVTIRACIGAVTVTPAEHSRYVEQPALILRDADTALMSAKNRGQGRIEYFTACMREDASARLDEEGALASAIAAGELAVVYQPVVSLATGLATGVEALVRWPRSGRAPMTPDQFIPLAEECGLIVELGRFVLNQACQEASSWAQTIPALATGSVSVNVSGRQLDHPDFLTHLDTALATSGLPASRLVLEITETTLVGGDAVQEGLSAIRSRGIGLALDDFGTGYRSLNYVKRFPLNIIKIDKSFVDLITGPGDGTEFTEVVLKLAQAMGMTTTAEGVETPGQAAALAALGCTSGQGWYWARAVPHDQLAAALPTPGKP